MRIIALLLILLVSNGGVAQEIRTAYTLGVDGVKKVNEGAHAEGIKLLKQARNLEPEQYDYTFEIGRAYFLSGDARKAEKYLFPLQYHVDVQPDLYVLLAKCYFELNEAKKTPDEERKKELDALRYGIQKLPHAGNLYLELGQRNIQMEEPIKALAVFENGILNAPSFAENYFWASKLLKATGNQLWTWIYAEVFLNMTDNDEMKRTAALLIDGATSKVFSNGWKADPEKMDQELRFLLSEQCSASSSGWDSILKQRKCLMNEWQQTEFPVRLIIDRLNLLDSKGYLEAYLAGIYLESDKKLFLPWLAEHANEFEQYRKWRYWNPMSVNTPVRRL